MARMVPCAKVEHNQADGLTPDIEDLWRHEDREDGRPSEQRQRRGCPCYLGRAFGGRRLVIAAVERVLAQGAPDVGLGDARLGGEVVNEGSVWGPTCRPLGLREDRPAVIGSAVQPHQVEVDVERADPPNARVQHVEFLARAQHFLSHVQVLDGFLRVPDGVQAPRSVVQRRDEAGPAESQPRPPLHPIRVRGVQEENQHR
mmetsp:Transcript_131923/g.422439  ORF Transcript_131923/g.422439 Transcript_131923/m.422439 type:complete len:201 (-) Transcript_131923:216-818(-)